MSLFTSGYGVNVGTIQAFMNKGGVVVLDHEAHMSILEGARTSSAEVRYFRHNDMEDRDDVLQTVSATDRRVLVCAEGVYSSDGTTGPLAAIVGLAKRYGAYTLVDEAHSVLVAGPTPRRGREQGVLDEIDLYVMTFSKGFSGIGGAVLARPEVARYINWYARCRMFSCALPPGVTGGMLAALEIAASADGGRPAAAAPRQRRAAARRPRGPRRHLRLPLLDRAGGVRSRRPHPGDPHGAPPGRPRHRRAGLPRRPRDRARFRLFATAHHSPEQCERAADIVKAVAAEHGFLQAGAP